jgi:hypothetical protein
MTSWNLRHQTDQSVVDNTNQFKVYMLRSVSEIANYRPIYYDGLLVTVLFLI